MIPSTRKMDITGHYHIVGGLYSDDHDEKEERLTVYSIDRLLQLNNYSVCHVIYTTTNWIQSRRTVLGEGVLL